MAPKWKTHPWLKFELNLDGVAPSVWMKLGEARSKCDHLKGVPLRPSVSKELHEIFLAKGVHATTAIEGNTLSEREVLDVLRKNDKTPKSQNYLKTEVNNVLEAANGILDRVEKIGTRDITKDEIKGYNRLILRGMELEDYVVPGEVSKVQVGVPGYKGLPIEHCEEALTAFCSWLNADFRPDTEENTVVYGLLKAIVSHVYLVWIHPFGDGNGRTARLLEVRFLLEAGIPSAAGHLLSNHYNRTRAEYYRQLARASQSGGDLRAFIDYAITGFVEQIRDQLQLVKKQQWDVTWINYIHELFSDGSSIAMKRQRKLAIALSVNGGSVSKDEIRSLDPEVSKEYAYRGEKTITRDLNSLISMNIVEKSKDGYRAKKETVLQFLPRAKQGEAEAQLREAKIIKQNADGQLSLPFLN